MFDRNNNTNFVYGIDLAGDQVTDVDRFGRPTRLTYTTDVNVSSGITVESVSRGRHDPLPAGAALAGDHLSGARRSWSSGGLHLHTGCQPDPAEREHQSVSGGAVQPPRRAIWTRPPAPSERVLPAIATVTAPASGRFSPRRRPSEPSSIPDSLRCAAGTPCPGRSRGSGGIPGRLRGSPGAGPPARPATHIRPWGIGSPCGSNRWVAPGSCRSGRPGARRRRGFEVLGLLMDLVPGHVQCVGEEEFHEPMPAEHRQREPLAGGGEPRPLVGRV